MHSPGKKYSSTVKIKKLRL